MILLLLLTGAGLDQGFSSLESGEYEDARRYFASFVSQNPSHSDVAQATLWLARLEDDPSTARELYLRVVANHSRSAYADSALYEAASIDYAFGLYQQAATKYKQLLSLYPQSPLLARTNYWLGVCYVVLGDRSSARTHFSQARETGVGTLWSRLAAAELAQTGKDTAQATPSQSGGFAVQVGSFTDRARAERLLSNYTEQGQPGEIRKVTIGGNLFYRVWLGPFPDQQDAEAFAENLKAQGKAAMVIKR